MVLAIDAVTKWSLSLLVPLFWGGLVAPASAAVIEEVIDLPVQLRNRFGVEVAQSIRVGILRDDAVVIPQPFLVLGHGRPANGSFSAYKWTNYRKQGNYFVSRGFAVFIPLRVGYGETGGLDVEESGKCNAKDYDFSYAVGGLQTRKVVDYAKTLPYINRDKGVIAGQSFGGTLAIEAAAQNIPGVIAAINFAGGGGGDPVGSPERPCRADKLQALFAAYGRTAKVPTLWLYSENDRYWGNRLPKEWFDAFAEAGGHGEFVRLAPVPDADGHLAFSRSMNEWAPHVDRFLKSLGL